VKREHNKENEMICPTCKGKGKVTITSNELKDGQWVELPNVEINCINCDGSGEVDKAEQKAQDKARDEFWCACNNPSGDTSFYEDGRGHGWACDDCGKVLQTG